MSLCMHPRCHLMREHDPDECGWPAEKPVPNLMKALRESLEKAVQPPATPQEPAPSIDCPLCGEEVRQVSSATLSLALWQHVRWVCRRASTPSPEGQTWQPIETAPKDGTRVLLFHHLWQAASTGQFYGSRQGWKLDSTLPPFTMQPIRWRHLPLPPTPEGTAK